MRPTEICIYLLLISGLMVSEYTHTPWDIKRWALTLHIVAVLILFPMIIMAFWSVHRNNLDWSRRAAQRRTGRIIETFLFIMLACGVWLLFVGENRTQIGAIAHIAHLATALPLAFLIIWHGWKSSLVRKGLKAVGIVTCIAGVGLVSLPVEPAFAASAQETLSKPIAASGSFIWGPGKTEFYSANFENGTVSRIDRKTSTVLAETEVGRLTQNIALTDKGVLAVTDQLDGSVSFLDAKTLDVKKRVVLGGRPYGVIHDPKKGLFWVTMAEGNELVALLESGAIWQRLNIEGSPRGLTLLEDGRLLVTSGLSGVVTIVDISAAEAKLGKTIQLASYQDPVQTNSQGVPRVLDRIVVSSDGKQAWLPHHLWNFDHSFQFQSIIFPAISLLWLGQGDEHEVIARRKQLFKQINVIESGNIQRIVSNPTDAVFSDDGNKVFAIMAGSEDLVVFDLTRAAPIAGDESSKTGPSGANASQIFPLPGQNPRGILSDGEKIYVQNAMSLDITEIDTGGGGPFAEMQVTKKSFAPLSQKDRLDPNLRRGLRIFHLAKTDAFPKTPVAGTNWMSCSSCHLDGFNYTNGQLLRDTVRDDTVFAPMGHASIEKFVAGDVAGDYIRMIQNTQGGFGADTRFPDVAKVDPAAPSKIVAAMMEDLHSYVTSRDNMPNFPSWMTANEGHAQIGDDAWTNPAICGSCHTRIFNDWNGSMHRLMGESNPYYTVAEDIAAQKVGEEFRGWCMGCHTPQAQLSGITKTSGPSHLYETGPTSLLEDLKISAYAIDEGTSCLFCHRSMSMQNAGPAASMNAAIDIQLDNRATYPGEESRWSVARWVADRAIRAEPEEHSRSYLPETIKSPAYCSTCHDEVSPGVGAQTTSTYGEWVASPYNAPNDPSQNRTCADCHMHATIAQIGENVPGAVTDMGDVKPNYTAHHFVGAQYHLVGLRDPQRKEMSIDLLKTSAQLDLSLTEKGNLNVKVANVGAGHNLPTGASDFRQLWLDVSVKDASGKVVLQSGALDDAGALDKSARLFRNGFSDRHGGALGINFFEYQILSEDTRIPAKGHRDEVFDLPENVKFPISVSVKLMFRTFPQSITKVVQARYPNLPAPEAIELNLEQKVFRKD